MAKRYAGHPTALVYEDDGGKPGKKKVEQLLWGDELRTLEVAPFTPEECEAWLLR